MTIAAALLTLSGVTLVATEMDAQTLTPSGLADWSGVSWSRVGTLPRDVAVSSLIAWQDGFVLVGADRPDGANRHRGGVWRSTDLSRWSRQVTAGGPDGATELSTVVALPERLVAFGTEQPASCVGLVEAACGAPTIIVWTSTDGITWQELAGSDALGAGTIRDVAPGPDQALAVGDQGWSEPAIWRSTDGVGWALETLSGDTFADAHLFGVTSFAGGWVVTGMTGGHELRCCDDGWAPDETQPAAWWSTDGLAWQQAGMAAAASEWGARLGEVHAGSGGLVAVDDGVPVDVDQPEMSPGSSAPTKPRTVPGRPQLWSSPDGRAWTPSAVDPDTAFRPIASDGTAIVGRSTHGGLAVSTDGIAWGSLASDGKAPGSRSPMDWAFMTPSWLLPDGIITVAIHARGGATLRLLLARATLGMPAATPSAPAPSSRPLPPTLVPSALSGMQARPDP